MALSFVRKHLDADTRYIGFKKFAEFESKLITFDLGPLANNGQILSSADGESWAKLFDILGAGVGNCGAYDGCGIAIHNGHVFVTLYRSAGDPKVIEWDGANITSHLTDPSQGNCLASNLIVWDGKLWCITDVTPFEDNSRRVVYYWNGSSWTAIVDYDGAAYLDYNRAGNLPEYHIKHRASRLFVFNGELYLIASRYTGSKWAWEVWRFDPDDYDNFTKIFDSDTFDDDYALSAIVDFNGTCYLIGNILAANGNGTVAAKLYVSSDMENWTEGGAFAALGFPFGEEAFNGSLFFNCLDIHDTGNVLIQREEGGAFVLVQTITTNTDGTRNGAMKEFGDNLYAGKYMEIYKADCAVGPGRDVGFLKKVQEPLMRFEILCDGWWKDLTNLGGKNYLIDASISLGGANIELGPVAGSWNATINNEDGIFHPAHPSSAYKYYFRSGRKVRISIGAKYAGIDHYWQRMIGYMEDPHLSGDGYEIQLSGFDYMQLITDVNLKKPDNYWGASQVFNSVSSEGSLGDEIYDEKDAMDIDDETDNVANWDVSNCTFVSLINAGGGSVYVGKMVITGLEPDPIAKNTDVDTAVAEKEYFVSFKYKRQTGTGPLSFEIWQSVDGDLRRCGGLEGLNSDAWVTESFYFTALTSGPIQIWLRGGHLNDEFRFDLFSIKEHTAPIWYRYELPAACEGVYYATLDGEPVWQGEPEEGWYYDPETRYFYFDEEKRVDDGVNNLIIYYFTEQIPENVIADILVTARLYANRVAALVVMDYTATGITIPRVYFEAGTAALDAIYLLCERCDYMFYFSPLGVPIFQPAATKKPAGSEDFAFLQCDIEDPDYHQEKGEIWNRIVIEGEKEAQPVGREETMPSELRGEASDETSIDLYKEHTKTIENYLFQGQAEIDAMCAVLLAKYKDPKWYFDFFASFNPIPLVLGNTLRWQSRLTPGQGKAYGTFKYGDGTKYGSNGIVIAQRGLIRDIKIDQCNIQYKNQEVI